MANVLNIRTARVIDPILTTAARGYVMPELVGGYLFPTVTVMQRGGTRIEFGREDFLIDIPARAPYAEIPARLFGHSGQKYSVVQYALAAPVANEWLEDIDTVVGYDYAMRSVMGVRNAMMLRLEKEQADAARLATNYDSDNRVTLSGTAQWSNHAVTGTMSDPHQNIKDARETIRTKTGMYPNTLLLSARVYTSLTEHPNVIERLKHTVANAPATKTDLSAQFEVPNIYVGTSVYATGPEVDTFTDIWGRDAILASTPIRTLAAMGFPSYGYTYQLQGYPMVTRHYQVNERNGWAANVIDECTAEVVGSDAGYLWTNAVA